MSFKVKHITGTINYECEVLEDLREFIEELEKIMEKKDRIDGFTAEFDIWYREKVGDRDE